MSLMYPTLVTRSNEMRSLRSKARTPGAVVLTQCVAAASVGAFASGEPTGEPSAEGGGASPQAAFRSPPSPRCFGARAGLASDTRFPHRRRGSATGKHWLQIQTNGCTFAILCAFFLGQTNSRLCTGRDGCGRTCLSAAAAAAACGHSVRERDRCDLFRYEAAPLASIMGE